MYENVNHDNRKNYTSAVIAFCHQIAHINRWCHYKAIVCTIAE